MRPLVPGWSLATAPCPPSFDTISSMLQRLLLLLCALWLMAPEVSSQRPPAPPASAGRVLLLPKRIVSGEAATLAVLDASGRLTPGVTVNFSNGDHLVTNATGRGLCIAPPKPGVT